MLYEKNVEDSYFLSLPCPGGVEIALALVPLNIFIELTVKLSGDSTVRLIFFFFKFQDSPPTCINLFLFSEDAKY